MSYKFDSLIMILNKLDGAEAVTVHSLMNDLEISERTAHRYIKTLQVAGFPIGYDRSKGIYAFDEGYSLKKPDLSIEEMLAFALAKKVLGSFGAGMEKGPGSIEARLSKKKADLPDHIILTADAGPSENPHLSTIHNAITSFRRIEIGYKALHSNQLTTRIVDPYYLFFSYQDGFWNLRGYCHLREEFRTFAPDRIVSLKVLEQHFLPKKISPEEELSGSFGSVIDGEPVEVILRFDPSVIPQVLRKKWHQSQQNNILKDKRLELTFSVNGIEGIKQWIYRWIPFVEVVGPKELRDEVLSDLTTAAQKNKVNRD